MAQRRDVQQLNHENMTSHLLAKSNITKIVEPVKRPALGDVGNKLPAVQKTQSTLLKKSVFAVPPENNLTKKTALPKKDVKKCAVKPSELKNSLKRQESILKQIPENVNAPKNVKRISSLSSKMQKTITSPDDNIQNDPQMVPEYLDDIFAYLRETEVKMAIRENFLEGHETTSRMRAILVNWLVEINVSFQFTLDTLHLCIGIVDRYLQENKKIGKNTLQLVGTSAMLVACKYEEIYVPDLEDFRYMCDNIFSKRQILQMEIEILKRLDFNLGHPLSIQFYRRFSKIAEVRLEHHNLGKYILELVLLESDLSHVRPSLQAAATCCLSMGILNDTMDLQKLWTPTLVHYTTFDYYEIRPVMADLAYLLVKSEQSKYQSIRKKYASAKFGKISLNQKLNGPLVRKLTAGKK